MKKRVGRGQKKGSIVANAAKNKGRGGARNREYELIAVYSRRKKRSWQATLITFIDFHSVKDGMGQGGEGGFQDR